MKKSTLFKLRKVLLVVLILVFVASFCLNIYQYTEINKHLLNDNNMSQNYMNAHEGAFANALNITSNKSILEYIKSPNNLSDLIEKLDKSEDYYREAADLVQNHSKTIKSEQLIDTYLSSLKNYRGCIETNNIKSYSDNINQIINDLQTISNWLIKKYNKNDFTVYTDDDFYNNVYKKLGSNVKKGSFF